MQENLLTREELPKRIILDIGSGPNPTYRREDTATLVDKGDFYVALDIDLEPLKSAKLKFELDKTKGVGVKADAQHLPFRDNTIQEVIMYAVLNAPRFVVEPPKKEEKEDNPYKQSKGKADIEDRHDALIRMIDESARVLKTGGKLKIFENYGTGAETGYVQDSIIAMISEEDRFELTGRPEAPLKAGAFKNAWEFTKNK